MDISRTSSNSIWLKGSCVCVCVCIRKTHSLEKGGGQIIKNFVCYTKESELYREGCDGEL